MARGLKEVLPKNGGNGSGFPEEGHAPNGARRDDFSAVTRPEPCSSLAVLSPKLPNKGYKDGPQNTKIQGWPTPFRIWL